MCVSSSIYVPPVIVIQDSIVSLNYLPCLNSLSLCVYLPNCSASLSSVDSEESLRAAERLHNRQSRNSAGGISTHSLNEAELVVSDTFPGLICSSYLIDSDHRIHLNCGHL